MLRCKKHSPGGEHKGLTHLFAEYGEILLAANLCFDFSFRNDVCCYWTCPVNTCTAM